MAQGPQLKITETVWYGQTPFSPEIPKGKGLTFKAIEATSDTGPTVALVAAYRLGTPFLEYYGGQLPRAIWVVALDEEKGLAYYSDLNSPDHPPIRIETSDTAAQAALPGWSYESSHFNVDLAALLALPEQSAQYDVFLWLDDIVSPIEKVTVPANPARGKGRPVAAQPSQLLQFELDLAAPRPEPGCVTLALSEDSSSVRGAWAPANDARPFAFWLMVASHRDRRLEWMAVRADELRGKTPPVSFRVNPLDLIKTSGIEQKIFIMGLPSPAVPNVLVMRTE